MKSTGFLMLVLMQGIAMEEDDFYSEKHHKLAALCLKKQSKLSEIAVEKWKLDEHYFKFLSLQLLPNSNLPQTGMNDDIADEIEKLKEKKELLKAQILKHKNTETDLLAVAIANEDEKVLKNQLAESYEDKRDLINELTNLINEYNKLLEILASLQNLKEMKDVHVQTEKPQPELKSNTVGSEQTGAIFGEKESEYMILETLMKTGCLVNENASTEASNYMTPYESDEKESLEEKRCNFTNFMESYEDNKALNKKLSNLTNENRKLKESINNRILMHDEGISNRIPESKIEQMKAICKVGQKIKTERSMKNLRLNNPKTETDQFRTTKKAKERQEDLDRISKQKKKKFAKRIIQGTIVALFWFFFMHLYYYLMTLFGIIPGQVAPMTFSGVIFAAFGTFCGTITVFALIDDYFLMPLLNLIQPLEVSLADTFAATGITLRITLWVFYLFSHIF